MSALLGVSRQTVNAIETGRYDPSLPLAFDIARAFGTGVEQVFLPARDPEWVAPVLILPKRLGDRRLALRPHVAADLPAFQRFVGDPDSVRYMAFTPEQCTPEGAAALMQAVLDSYTTSAPILSLTVTDASDAYLGAAGAAPTGDGAVEVFVTLLPEYRGRGLSPRILDLLTAHLAACGANRAVADIVAENAASVAMVERAGFAREGPVERAPSHGLFAERGLTGLRYAKALS